MSCCFYLNSYFFHRRKIPRCSVFVELFSQDETMKLIPVRMGERRCKPLVVMKYQSLAFALVLNGILLACASPARANKV